MLLLVNLLLTCFFSAAQTEVPANKDIQVYFDDGPHFKYEPFPFQLKFGFRMQNRAVFEDYDDRATREDKIEFLNRRFRLKFDGYIGDPRLVYKIQLGFTRGDMDFENTAFPNVLRDAAASWYFSDADVLHMGLMKLPGNRQRVISSGSQEIVERALTNATFNLDRDIGLQYWSRFFSSRPLWVKLAVSNGQGRAYTNEDMGLSYTARAEWLPLGNFKDRGDYYEGDLAFEESMKISLGVVTNLTKNATRTGGQIGNEFTDKSRHDMETHIADVLLKYRGWSFNSEYFRRNSENPVATATQTIFDGQGVLVQSSYIFANHYSPAIRWARIWGDDAVKTQLPTTDQYTLALTKYINKHKIKIQSDVTYERQENKITFASQDNWSYRLQLEIGF